MLTACWLAPTRAVPSGADAVDLWPAGAGWDAVVTPLDLGGPVLDRLASCPDDRQLLGPVLVDDGSAVLYWLVAPGASDDYPDQARLLGQGSWVGVPVSVDATAVRWAHLPDTEQLTPPAWLAVALWDQIHRTSNPRPGAAAMTVQPDSNDQSPRPAAEAERDVLMFRSGLGKLEPNDFQRLDELAHETASEAGSRAS